MIYSLGDPKVLNPLRVNPTELKLYLQMYSLYAVQPRE